MDSAETEERNRLHRIERNLVSSVQCSTNTYFVLSLPVCATTATATATTTGTNARRSFWLAVRSQPVPGPCHGGPPLVRHAEKCEKCEKCEECEESLEKRGI